MLPDEVSKPFSARMPFRLSGIENGRLRTEAEDSVLVVVVVFSGVFGINIDIHSVADTQEKNGEKALLFILSFVPCSL